MKMLTIEKDGVRYVAWKTKDGRLLRVADMDDAHLVSTIRMLERKVEAKHADACAHMSDPDDVTPEAEWMEHPVLDFMRFVAKTRGIVL